MNVPQRSYAACQQNRGRIPRFGVRLMARLNRNVRRAMTRIGHTLAAFAIAPLVPAMSFMAASIVSRGPFEIMALPIVAVLSYISTLAVAVPVHAVFLLLRIRSWMPYLLSGLGVAIILQLYWHSLLVAADSDARSPWWQPWPSFLAMLVVCVSTAWVFWLIAVRTSNFSSSGRATSARRST
jgi:hypothetical protein